MPTTLQFMAGRVAISSGSDDRFYRITKSMAEANSTPLTGTLEIDENLSRGVELYP
jgi:hypothetical protein